MLQTAMPKVFTWLFLHVITAAVGELEACKLQHLATIEDLKNELVALKQRSAKLEQDKQAFEVDQHLKTTEQAASLQSLQKVNCIIMLTLNLLSWFLFVNKDAPLMEYIHWTGLLVLLTAGQHSTVISGLVDHTPKNAPLSMFKNLQN